MVSTAIEATEARLREGDLAKVLHGALAASGKAGVKVRNASLRTAAPRQRPDDLVGFEFDVANPRATEWANQRAGDLITNVTRKTREAIRDLVEDAFEDQFDVDELADRIEDIIGDPDRAETIARTEVMKASNQGQLEAWTQAEEQGLLTGDEKKEWIVTPDDRLCPVCEPMDGVTVPRDADFNVNGESLDGPPAHPNCRCTLALSL